MTRSTEKQKGIAKGKAKANCTDISGGGTPVAGSGGADEAPEGAEVPTVGETVLDSDEELITK